MRSEAPNLGTLPGIPGSTAFGLNGFGQVVGAGRAGTGYKRSVRAFVYTNHLELAVIADLATRTLQMFP